MIRSDMFNNVCTLFLTFHDSTGGEGGIIHCTCFVETCLHAERPELRRRKLLVEDTLRLLSETEGTSPNCVCMLVNQLRVCIGVKS